MLKTTTKRNERYDETKNKTKQKQTKKQIKVLNLAYLPK